MTGSTNSTEQQALKQIEQNYAQALKYVNEMQNDLSEIAKDSKSAAKWKAKEHYTTRYWVSGGDAGGGYWESTVHTDASAVKKYNQIEKDIAALKKDYNSAEAALKKIDPNLEALCNTLNNLLNLINTLVSDGQAYAGGLLDSDLTKIKTLISDVISAMVQKVTTDKYTAEMDVGNLSDAQLDQLASKIMQTQASEQNDLNNMMSSMTKWIESLHQDSDNAKSDKASYDMWQKWGANLGFNNDNSKMAQDDRIMANAKEMIEGMYTLMSDISPELSGLMPEIQAAMNVISQVIKQIEKILSDSSLSTKAKKKEVMALVMFLLSFYQVIKQDVESHKAKNKENMSNGAMVASRLNIDDSIMNQKIKEEEEHNAKIMKATMIATEVVLGGLMMIAAPGVGTALLIAMVTAMEVMQTEGVINVTGSLAKAFHSKIGAEIFVTGMEMILTMGGGAALDAVAEQLLAKAAEDAVESSVQVASEVIEKAAEKAAASVGKAGDKAVIQAVKQQLTEMAEDTAEKTAQGIQRYYMKQAFSTLGTRMATGTFRETFQAAVENASKEAIDRMLEESTTIAKLAARGVQTSDAITSDVTSRAANEAVAQSTGKKFAEVAADSEKSNWDVAKSRGRWTALYGFASTGMFLDMLKKMHIDRGNEGWEETLQIIQSLLQMLALMMGSGMMNPTVLEESAGNGALTRIATELSVIPQAGQVGEGYSNSLTYDKQAETVKALQMDGSVADLLHSFIEQIQKDGNLERELFLKDQQQEQSSTQSLAAHINDGERAGIQILVSAAG